MKVTLIFIALLILLSCNDDKKHNTGLAENTTHWLLLFIICNTLILKKKGRPTLAKNNA